jgi:predicted esterase
MNEIKTDKIQINSEIPMTYHHLNQGSLKPLLLFFHGYADSARAFLRRAYPEMNENFEVLAVNGLFPVPQKKDNEWKQAYAWYFADFQSRSILIDPEVCAKAISHLIEKLQLQDRQKILIGFSQGGFFLPFVLPYLKNVKQMYSIGAAYREEDYKEILKIKLDALHGTEDEVIPHDMAESSFKEFVQKKNPQGAFHTFKGLKHTMNSESRLWLSEELNKQLEFILK